MIRRSEAFVPPTCPALTVGTEGDIENMTFLYSADPFRNEKGEQQVELITQFFKEDDPDDGKWTTVEMYAAYPEGSTEYADALLIGDGPQAEAMQARARSIMCERVATCHGLTDGACWALGEAALREINRQVVTELAHDA